MMMASNRGTLMELGITPIITSGMVFQLLAGTHILDIDMGLKTDRELYQTAQKLLAVSFTFCSSYECEKMLTVARSSCLSDRLVSTSFLVSMDHHLSLEWVSVSISSLALPQVYTAYVSSPIMEVLPSILFSLRVASMPLEKRTNI
jgi:hypothetical protein